jgi:uncharacterized cupredoxin-like copper-binding protein
MQQRFVFAIPLIIAVLLVAGCAGRPKLGTSAPVDVQVTATDFRYDASQTTFVAGQPYRFVATNLSPVTHDWVIAPRGGAEDEALVMVEDKAFRPGGTFTTDFTFPKLGNYEIACHVPGHYQAGMVLPITVN